MKVFLFIIMLFSLSASAQIDYSFFIKNYDQNLRIKEVSKVEYHVKDTTAFSLKINNNLTKKKLIYSKSGFLKEEIFYHKNKPQISIEYNYHERKLISSTRKDLIRGIEINKLYFKYNETEGLVRVFKNDTIQIADYYFGTNGKISKEIDRERYVTKEYLTNNGVNLIKCYNTNYGPYSYSLLKYDNKNRITEKIIHSSFLNEVSTDIYHDEYYDLSEDSYLSKAYLNKKLQHIIKKEIVRNEKELIQYEFISSHSLDSIYVTEYRYSYYD